MRPCPKRIRWCSLPPSGRSFKLMSMLRLPAETEWRISTYSGAGNNSCVEVALSVPGVVGVRDSTDPGGPVLVVAPSAWRALTSRIKNDEL
ncbi:DUF397 domain-containing protein [Actinomadura sp. GTD37]|uniref:DUF397 domain-containing protein n=1 Tax=Actinomadura sp. GTD37 TaxID=1778030 RepID=UPI0035C04E74